MGSYTPITQAERDRPKGTSAPPGVCDTCGGTTYNIVSVWVPMPEREGDTTETIGYARYCRHHWEETCAKEMADLMRETDPR
jgi:hypothetical protein